MMLFLGVIMKVNMVRKEGGSRVLSISKVLPPDWIAVVLTVVKKTESFVTVKIEKVK